MSFDQCYSIKTKCNDEALKEYLIYEDGTYMVSKPLLKSLGDLDVIVNNVIRTEAYKRYYNKCLEIKNLQGNCKTPL